MLKIVPYEGKCSRAELFSYFFKVFLLDFKHSIKHMAVFVMIFIPWIQSILKKKSISEQKEIIRDWEKSENTMASRLRQDLIPLLKENDLIDRKPQSAEYYHNIQNILAAIPVKDIHPNPALYRLEQTIRSLSESDKLDPRILQQVQYIYETRNVGGKNLSWREEYKALQAIANDKFSEQNEREYHELSEQFYYLQGGAISTIDEKLARYQALLLEAKKTPYERLKDSINNLKDTSEIARSLKLMAKEGSNEEELFGTCAQYIEPYCIAADNTLKLLERNETRLLEIIGSGLILEKRLLEANGSLHASASSFGIIENIDIDHELTQRKCKINPSEHAPERRWFLENKVQEYRSILERISEYGRITQSSSARINADICLRDINQFIEKLQTPAQLFVFAYQRLQLIDDLMQNINGLLMLVEKITSAIITQPMSPELPQFKMHRERISRAKIMHEATYVSDLRSALSGFYKFLLSKTALINSSMVQKIPESRPSVYVDPIFRQH